MDNRLLSRLNNFRSSTFFITAVVCYAVFVDQLFFAFILPVLPFSLPAYNGVQGDKVQEWTTTFIVIFGVASLVVCPFIGYWTDRHASRRVPFLVALVVLVASTLLMWLAKPMSLQIVSRVGQGIASAMVYIVGLTIIIDCVSTKHVAEYMGHVAMSMNVGSFVGPLLGGVVFKAGGYHAVWGMMLGFVILDCLLRFVMVEKVVREQQTNSVSYTENASVHDLPLSSQTMTEQKTLVVPVLTVSSEEVRSNRSSMEEPAPENIKSKRFEPRFKMPSGLYLLLSARMNTALFATCVQAMVFSGFETVLSLYVQEIWGYDSLGAGLVFIPLTIPAFFAPFVGSIVDRTTPRWVLVLGFLGMCPVLISTQFVRYNSIEQKALLCSMLVLIGTGITATLGPLTAEIAYVVENHEREQLERYNRTKGCGGGAYAQAYSLFVMAWSVGNIVGPLLCGFIRDSQGWTTMCWTIGIVSGVTAVPCLFFSGNRSSSDQDCKSKSCQ